MDYYLTLNETNTSIEHILTGFVNLPEIKSHLVNLYLKYMSEPIEPNHTIKKIGEIVVANYESTNPGIKTIPIYSNTNLFK